MVRTQTHSEISGHHPDRRFGGPSNDWSSGTSGSTFVVPPRPDRASVVPGGPSDIGVPPEIKDRLQIHSHTGMCQDYLNQFMYLVAFCSGPTDQLPWAPKEQFEHAIKVILNLISYQEHLEMRMRPNELTAASLEIVSALGKKRVKKLNETVIALKAFVSSNTGGGLDEQTLKVKISQVANKIGVLIVGTKCWKSHAVRPGVSSTVRSP